MWDISKIPWETALALIGAMAALVSIVAALAQLASSASSFRRFERWTAVGEATQSPTAKLIALHNQHYFMVRYVALNMSRSDRIWSTVGALLWITLTSFGMWVYRQGFESETEAGTARIAFWVCLVLWVAAAIFAISYPVHSTNRAIQKVWELYGIPELHDDEGIAVWRNSRFPVY